MCSMKLARAVPATFHQQSESLAKPLFVSMTHQHSKVRLSCVKVWTYVITTSTCNYLVIIENMLTISPASQPAIQHTELTRSVYVNVCVTASSRVWTVRYISAH